MSGIPRLANSACLLHHDANGSFPSSQADQGAPYENQARRYHYSTAHHSDRGAKDLGCSLAEALRDHLGF